jgi:hypothetical protein
MGLLFFFFFSFEDGLPRGSGPRDAGQRHRSAAELGDLAAVPSLLNLVDQTFSHLLLRTV